MGDIRFDATTSKAALVELLEQFMNNQKSGLQSDYDELKDVETVSSGGQQIHPNSPPQNVRVGAVNPWALAEAMLGRKIDRLSTTSAKILANVLQTDYDELFDMKYDSVLYAGLKLDNKERKAERLNENEMKLLKESDLETPDLSWVRHMDDLQKIGFKDMGHARVKSAHMQNGKLCLILDAEQIARTVSNHQVTKSLNELITPFRIQKGQWSPPNSNWRDMYDFFFQRLSGRVINDISTFRINEEMPSFHAFDDPVQGCTSNSWLISALFSVFWSDPACINRATRVFQDKDEKKRLSIKFFDKGGHNNNKTDTIDVNYEIPMVNSNNEPLYCRSSDGADIWPSLYEKAFAKWITGGNSQHPDITQTHSGDPVKAMAQINGRQPFYFQCDKHNAYDLLGVVRTNCVNFKTINPMTCWTFATGNMFKGSNLVANHAYSILGYTMIGDVQYIVLRNPWGVTEPNGLTGTPGLITHISPNVWYPASMVDQGGVFAMEPHAFKECFAWMGVAKQENNNNHHDEF
ncbi:Thiol protease-like protein [Cladobotryum mycophilum]|uniref:Thiol protease-like protein n=1 Tax=Cladobotryum mycophilum TaxID=491253 RepID=A0ABR0SI45_9HYPO